MPRGLRILTRRGCHPHYTKHELLWFFPSPEDIWDSHPCGWTSFNHWQTCGWQWELHIDMFLAHSGACYVMLCSPQVSFIVSDPHYHPLHHLHPRCRSAGCSRPFSKSSPKMCPMVDVLSIPQLLVHWGWVKFANGTKLNWVYLVQQHIRILYARI
jgi:hypothetical protein